MLISFPRLASSWLAKPRHGREVTKVGSDTVARKADEIDDSSSRHAAVLMGSAWVWGLENIPNREETEGAMKIQKRTERKEEGREREEENGKGRGKEERERRTGKWGESKAGEGRERRAEKGRSLGQQCTPLLMHPSLCSSLS